VTIINLERRIRKIEAQRFREDPALKLMSDDELVQALREVSADPADHVFADWCLDGCRGTPPPGALDMLQRSL
jgi:hypothetical protein